MGFMDVVRQYRADKRTERELERRSATGVSSERRRVLDGAKIREKANKSLKNLKENARKVQYVEKVERAGLAAGGKNAGRRRGFDGKFGFFLLAFLFFGYFAFKFFY